MNHRRTKQWLPTGTASVARPLLWAAAAVVATVASVAPTGAQAPDSLPFRVGERLEYQVSAGRFGRVGRGTMSIEGPEDVRGIAAWVLRFEIRGRVGPVQVENRTASWIAVAPIASLRFSKHERRFLRRHDERVEIYPGDRRWLSDEEEGDGGATPSEEPLDELSFIYFLRTLPLETGAHHSLSRHFQSGRNPVELSVLGRETIATPAGEFATVVVEMRVKDRRHYKSEGVIRLYLSDDALRVPVRIETAMPVAGKTVLTLVSCNAHSAEPARP